MFKSIQLEVTQQCPLACSHCSVSAGRGRTYAVAPGNALRLISLAADGGLDRMVFTGGEPLGYPSLLELLRACAARHLRSEVYTMAMDAAGLPISADAAATFTPLVGRWWVSIHGTPMIHDRVTGAAGSLARTLTGVDRLIGSGGQVSATMVVAANSLEHISTVACICRDHGISELRVFTIVNQGRAAALPRDNIDGAELAARASDASRQAGIPVRLGTSAAAQLGITDSCCGGTDELVVNPAGWVSPCHSVEPYPSRSDFDNVFLAGPAAVFERSPRMLAVRHEATRRRTAGVGEGCVTRGIHDCGASGAWAELAAPGRTVRPAAQPN